MLGGDNNLYSIINNKYTLKGTGYKDEQIALKTLKLIQNRSIIYQKSLIITLYYRALHHQNQTPDMQKAMKIFKTWLIKNKNNHIKYNYLDLKLVNKYEKLADIYDISHVARGLKKGIKSDKGFVVMYRLVKGNYKKLAFIPVHKKYPDKMDYDILREKFINARLGQMKNSNIGLYNKSGLYKDLPTIQHTVLIMNGYSPDPNGLKQKLKLLKKL